MGIPRVKIKDEKWYLRVGGKDVWDVITVTKRERNILNSIRRMLIAEGITNEHIELTNREKFKQNVHVSKERLIRRKALDRRSFD